MANTYPEAAHAINVENHDIWEKFDRLVEMMEGVHGDLEQKLLEHIEFLDAVNQGKVDTDQQKINRAFQAAERELEKFMENLEIVRQDTQEIEEEVKDELEKLEGLRQEELGQ